MILEYILLLVLTTTLITTVIIKGPNDAFKKAGPKLGARIEKNLVTGDRFSADKNTPSVMWRER